MTVEFYNESQVELVNFTGGDNMVAMAAWVSNGLDQEERLEDQKKVAGLINYLYSNRHMSPFEHGQYTFKITCPIFVAREFHRHRTQSYNEISGRYSEMKPRFYVPSTIRPVVQSGKIGAYKFEADEVLNQAVINELMEGSEEQWNRYIRLKEMGVANEVARMALTINLITEFYATVNPRNLMAFLDLRADDQALFEIRDVAYKMEDFLEEKMPLTYQAWLKGRNPEPEAVITDAVGNEIKRYLIGGS